MRWRRGVEHHPDFHYDLVADVQAGDPERAFDLFVDCSWVDEHRTIRVHPGVVVRIDRARVVGIHKSAIHHVILVEPEPIIGSGVRAPTGAEFNRATLRTWSATHRDHRLERHDLTEVHAFPA